VTAGARFDRIGSHAQRGRPREAGVDPGVGVHAGLPRLRLLVVVVVLRVVMVVVVPVLLAARGQRVRRRALLPPVLRPVHLDLLLPALLAAERRVTSADRRTTYVKNNKNNKKKSCGGETSIVRGVAWRGDLYMKMSPESDLAQREHSSRKWWIWTTSASWT